MGEELDLLRAIRTDIAALRAEMLHLISPQVLQFTERQQAILKHLSKGASNKMIGLALELPESTVKVHVREIMRKLNVTNRTQAALMAARLL